MMGVHLGMFGVLWQMLCLRVFLCILGVLLCILNVLLGILGVLLGILGVLWGMFRVLQNILGVLWGKWEYFCVCQEYLGIKNYQYTNNFCLKKVKTAIINETYKRLKWPKTGKICQKVICSVPIQIMTFGSAQWYFPTQL